MAMSEFSDELPMRYFFCRGMMRRFITMSTLPPEEFLRDVGVTLDQFLRIRDYLVLLIAAGTSRTN